MSERERWIVYPLLFFALGAALRDKVLQRVDAKEVYCESLRIVDHQEPTKLLAELTFRRGQGDDPTQLADRVGILRLIDSDGHEICRMADISLIPRFSTKLMEVRGGTNNDPLVLIGAELVPGMSFGGIDRPVTQQGVIFLNNRRLGTPLAPPKKTRSILPAEPKTPPADEAPKANE